MTIDTYSRHTQADLGLDDDQWFELREFLEEIETSLSEVSGSYPQVVEIEEGPPRISSNGEFCPWGWVGTYPGDIVVTPGKISESTYDLMLRDLRGWVEMMGADLMQASLPLSANLLVDSETRIAPYSRALIEYTETMIGSRLPVEVNRPQRKGYQPRGRPNFSETFRLRGQGSRQVVSDDVEFSFETLQNYLLVRFHAELLSEMQRLADQYDYYKDAFQKQMNYHQEFITSGIPGDLLDESMDILFSDPAVMTRLRREATDEMAEIVDLWEAYRRDVAFESNFADRLNTAIKPVSKVYELWCLGAIIDSLAARTGFEPEHSSIKRVYEFGDAVSLHYNRRLRSHSRYLSPMFGVGSGEPDFAIEHEGKIVWIGDAKFKTFQSMGLSDYRRFLVYLIDFVSHREEPEGTILYPAEEPAPKRHRVDGNTVTHVSARPDESQRIAQYIENKLSVGLA